MKKVVLYLAMFVAAVGTLRAQQSPHGDIRMACEVCHSTNGWTMRSDAKFDHATTGFTLLGKHKLIDCKACHESLKFTGVNPSCTSCHADIHQGELGPNCMRCHSNESWIIRDMRQMHQQTRFPLVGNHALIDCEQCHAKSSVHRYAGTPLQCVGCHRTDFVNAKNPNHVAAGFSTACEKCHASTSAQWSSGFDHALTRFPLTGAHRSVICSSCHKNNQFTALPVDCFSCHSGNFTSAQSPNHQSGNFSHTCLTCHNASAWQPATFDHSSTHFALTGAHRTVACQSCHISGNYTITYTGCYSCHQSNFTTVTNPVHTNFSHDCLTCHTQTAWNPATFDHSTTHFPLTGSHVSVACNSCHTNSNFRLTFTDCYQCHTSDFQRPTNPNHVTAALPHDCTTCHNTTVWTPSSFNHSSTHFTLTGAHLTVACQSCHTSGNYNITYTGCYSCHQSNFTTATNPVHTNFSHDCLTCHTQTAWNPATFDHSTTHFALTGSHITVACNSCHTNGNFRLTFNDCYQCHTADYQRPTNPNHVTAALPHDCTTCHSTAAWTPSSFDHATTHFALTGAHRTVPCQSCHTSGNYAITYTGCYTCHQSDFNGVTSPSHTNFSHDCTLCHSQTAWNPATFDHSASRFPLTGAHASVACNTCHTNNNYALTYTDCYQCHTSDYQRPTNPNHVTAALPHDCTTCHSTTAWTPSTFDHSSTKFPLTGAHHTLECQTCHGSANYSLVFSGCYSCHQTDFTGAANPVHTNFSHDCLTCHTQSGWSPATFDHSTTHFQLTGAHTSVACNSCHTNGNFQLTFTDCYQCHTADFQRPTNPNHVTASLPHDCTTCHSTTVWTPSTFNHSSTHFPLAGAHATVACQSCHTAGNFNLVFTDCYSCHQSDFTSAQNPNHATFSHNCLTCHTQTAWNPATYDHSTTHFPLTGTHTSVACISCHTNGNFQLTFTDCYQCHTADFQRPTNPNHVTASLPHDCTTCHSTTVWTPSTFNHSSTHFPLAGAHATVACQSCHTSGNFNLVFTDCYSCHQNDFTSAQNPVHTSFDHNCLTCHTQTGWSPATFDHSTTHFPLTGNHVAVACNSCHTSGNFRLSFTDCYQCHTADYQRPTNPNHVTAALPHDCSTCHSTTAWLPSTFNHSNTAFALTGAHTTVACASCHTNSNYSLTFTDCYQCHSVDFARPTNPNHVTANFGHDCRPCHTTTAWLPSTFNHDTQYFKINSGTHRGRWTLCSTCHANASSFAEFTCFSCHEHNQTSTDSHHTRVNGYSYVSSECYRCHRNV